MGNENLLQERQRSIQSEIRERNDSIARLMIVFFRGRPEVAAEKYFLQDGGHNYSPACLNKFWRKAGCELGMKDEDRTRDLGPREHACDNCPVKQPFGEARGELFIQALKDHLVGRFKAIKFGKIASGQSPMMLGVYPLLDDGTVHFAALDIDDHKREGGAELLVAEARDWLAQWEIPFLLERSSSGAGFHVWIGFSSPVPAWQPRRVLAKLIEETNLSVKDPVPEIFPKHDNLGKNTKGLGNLILIPYSGFYLGKPNVGTSLLEPDTLEPTQQIAHALQSAIDARIDPNGEDWKTILDELGVKEEVPAKPRKKTTKKATNGEAGTSDTKESSQFFPGRYTPEELDHFELEGAGEGCRHDALVCLAARWRAQGADDDTMRIMVYSWAETKTDPPLVPGDEKEVDDIIHWAIGLEVGPTEPEADPAPPAEGAEAIGGGNGSDPVSKTSFFDPGDFILFHQTDLGNARRLIHYHGKILRFCPQMGKKGDRGKWLWWSGKNWQEDEDGEVTRLCKDTTHEIHNEANRAPQELRDDLRKHAFKSESAKGLWAMQKLAESEPGVPIHINSLDADPMAINCQNGVVDLKTGQLHPHDPKELHSRILPVKYDPKARCPTWMKFLTQIMDDDEDLVLFLQRATGYALTGLSGEQVMFLMHGTGQNGKSTFLETIRYLMGDYSSSTDFKTFLEKKHETVRNDLAMLARRRMVSAVESQGGSKFDEVIIKQVTGGDTIVARFLYGEYFEFAPTFKLFLAANYKPTIRGNDLAIWRRVRLIPFTVTIADEDRDNELPAKLRREAPGILTWAVQGCLDWQKSGLNPPEKVLVATREYQEEMDMLAEFIRSNCILATHSRSSHTELYAAYKAWCEDNNEYCVAKKTFGTLLSEKGFKRSRGTGGKRMWNGIALSSSAGCTNEDHNHWRPLNSDQVYCQTCEPWVVPGENMEYEWVYQR